MELNRKIQVHMLPTEDKTGIFGLILNGTEILQCSIISKIRVPGKSLSNGYHLYFTSDEKIKDGDNIISLNGGENGEHLLAVARNIRYHKTCRKIIGTTDTKLNFNKSKTFKDVSPVTKVVTFDTVVLTKLLPQPPKSFIEAFCKAGGIKKVIVEYEEKYIEPPSNIHSNRGYFITQPKVNSQNEITIHPIKNSWDREEVIKLYKSAYKNGFVDREKNNNYNDSWIEKTYKK